MAFISSVPLPSTTSKRSLIKKDLKNHYYNGNKRYVQKDFEFGIQKHLEVFKTLPWVNFKKLTDEHIIVWLSNPTQNTSDPIS